jgi:hypothetical protein
MSEDTMLTTEDVDLSSDPFADNLTEELTARAPRRYATRTTLVLAGLVLAAGGFLAGAQVQKNFGTPAAASTSSNRNAFLAGGAFSGQRQGQGGGQAAATGASPSAAVTTGKVKLVDGTTVYVETADGTVITVKTSGSTAVQVAQKGALSDLAPGTQVSVEGSPSGDGVVTATKVTGSR